MPLFDVRQHDADVYAKELSGFLPERIIDIHTHVWKKEFIAPRINDGRTVTWPSKVAEDNPINHLLETYKLMFPGKRVTPLIFSVLGSREDNFTSANSYTSDCAKKHDLPALLYARPDWDGAKLEQELAAGSFLGIKVYLSLSDVSIPRNNITIFDFLPHKQLEVVNRRKGIVMLHIPRDNRLRDPLNISEILTITEMYGNLSLIIAHVGRAYCEEDVGDAFEKLAPVAKLLFDFSANTNGTVFKQLLEKVGPDRVLFGSDLPIARMRMKRVCESGKYVNIVGKGLYGDVSNDSNMREVSDAESAKHTYFMYEELLAFKDAAQKVGLSSDDLKKVFFGNAKRIIELAGGKIS